MNRTIEVFRQSILATKVPDFLRRQEGPRVPQTKTLLRSSQFWRKTDSTWSNELPGKYFLAHFFMVGGNSNLYSLIKADFPNGVITIEEQNEEEKRKIQSAIRDTGDVLSNARSGFFPYNRYTNNFYSLVIGWDVLHAKTPEDLKRMVLTGVNMVHDNGLAVFDSDQTTAKICESLIAQHNAQFEHPILMQTVEFGDFQDSRKRHIPGVIMKFRKQPPY